MVFFGCIKSLVKYCLQALALNQSTLLQERGTLIFYSDVFCDVCVEFNNLAYCITVWSFFGISFTLVDLFLFKKAHSSLTTLAKRIIGFRKYLRTAREIDTRFPDATREELDRVHDNCAICREPLESAKRLPCLHLFHRSCLRQWIEVASTHNCPVCRAPLVVRSGPTRNSNSRTPAADPNLNGMNDLVAANLANLGFTLETRGGGTARQTDTHAPDARGVSGVAEQRNQRPGVRPAENLQQVTTQPVFQFHSRNWSSWLPNFSLEVLHANVGHVGPVREIVENTANNNTAPTPDVRAQSDVPPHPVQQPVLSQPQQPVSQSQQPVLSQPMPQPVLSQQPVGDDIQHIPTNPNSAASSPLSAEVLRERMYLAASRRMAASTQEEKRELL